MKLSGIKDLGSQFICSWVSSHSYWLLPQTLPWQPNPLYLCGSQPNSHIPSDFSSLSLNLPSPFFLVSLLHLFSFEPPTICPHFSYSLSLVGVQIITFSSIPMQSHFRLEFQGKIIHFKDFLETFSKHQIAFSNELPKGTNSTWGPTWI